MKLRRIKKLKGGEVVQKVDKTPEKGIHLANDEEYFKMILSQKIRTELGFDVSSSLTNNNLAVTQEKNLYMNDMKQQSKNIDIISNDFSDQNQNEIYKLKTASPDDYKNK